MIGGESGRSKMVKGILFRPRIVRGKVFPQSTCRPSVLLSYIFGNHFATLGAEAGGNASKVEKGFIDQGFRTHYDGPDGRKSQFATVVVKEMKRETPPLRIWEEACALMGGNSPTLAVAFISKPTESARRAVEIFADQLLQEGKVEGLIGERELLASSGAGPFRNAAQIQQRPSSERAMEGQAPQGWGRNRHEQEYVPLIGCVIDDLGGEFDNSDSGGFQSAHEGNAASSRPENVVNSAGMQACEGPSEAVNVISGPVHSSEFLSQDESGDDGTFSDWETLCEEYGEEAIKALDLTEDSDDDGEDVEEDIWSEAFDEKVSRKEFASFLNALVDSKGLDADSMGDEDSLATNGGERHSRLLSREIPAMENDREITPRITKKKSLLQRLGRYYKASGLVPPRTYESNFGAILGGPLFSDVEGTITVNEPGGITLSGPDIGKQDPAYRLVLCVGHMPGSKAVSFHSATTGLPRLPDLEKAVVENNPHCLLIGAPGFLFPDFLQRLASVFPASSRGGAFLAPLFTSKKNQWRRVTSESQPGPLILGSSLCTSGVVGLAISSREKGYRIPVGAFAQCARMTVGMPRIRGLVFLDEAVSKSLFLPQNRSSRDFLWSAKGGPAPPSVLGHLKMQLDNENAVPVPGRESAGNEPVDMGKSLPTSIPGTRKLGSFNGDVESGALEKMPLAVLDSVLFPGWSTPFYIYEPCYRLMVRQCLERGTPFGLSSICNESWSADPADSAEVIGTVVNLKVHTFEGDCRSYIIARGVCRFRAPRGRIRPQPGSFGLTLGQVQLFDDQECETAVEMQELLRLANRAVTLCCKLVTEAQSPGVVRFIDDPRLASFAVGHVLDVPMRVKRRWLKMTDTRTRLLEQITFLETKVPTLKGNPHPKVG